MHDTTPAYPFGDLGANLAAFCQVLRRDHGFDLGPGETTDAARALTVVDPADQQRVRDAWRAILSSNVDTAGAFDRAFDAFFFPGPAGIAQPGLPPVETDSGEERAATGRRPRSRAEGDAPRDASDDGGGAPVTDRATPEGADDAGVASAHWLRASASLLEAEGTDTVTLRPVTDGWRRAARLLIRRVELGLSRRWRPARQGRRFDLRRTWRASLQTGGEAVTARWLRRVARAPRFVLLIDGSRSMSDSRVPALDLAVAVASATPRIEVCVFSTALCPLTAEVRRAAAGHTATASIGRHAWGGGTSIGQSLRTYLRRPGGRQLSPTTLVVIVSDGLDIGEPAILADGMRELHRRSAGVLWLNPLADTPGFEPTSRGMTAARPFITTLASVTDPASLVRVARHLRLRR